MRRPTLSLGSTATNSRASRCTTVNNTNTSTSCSISNITTHLRHFLSLIISLIILTNTLFIIIISINITTGKDKDKSGAVPALDHQPSCQAP